MTKQYRQELRPTGKIGEYQMFYIEETLSPAVELEISNLKAERLLEENKDELIL